MSECVKKVEKGISDINEWMRKNMRKLSDDKTEVLVISSPYFTDGLYGTHLRIVDVGVQTSEPVHNLDVIFGNNLDISNHIKSVCMASFYPTETSQLLHRYLEP